MCSKNKQISKERNKKMIRRRMLLSIVIAILLIETPSFALVGGGGGFSVGLGNGALRVGPGIVQSGNNATILQGGTQYDASSGTIAVRNQESISAQTSGSSGIGGGGGALQTISSSGGQGGGKAGPMTSAGQNANTSLFQVVRNVGPGISYAGQINVTNQANAVTSPSGTVAGYQFTAGGQYASVTGNGIAGNTANISVSQSGKAK